MKSFVSLRMTLLENITELKNSPIRKKVGQKIKEFKQLGKQNENEIFKELCFCLLTANYDADKAIAIQKNIGESFITMSETDLSAKLKRLGYRFPNVRAKYIVEARKHIDELKKALNCPDKDAREWLVKNIKGLGMKEAGHFLRNIGCTECAIIDFHILDLLAKNGLIKKPKTITPKKYLEIEKKLKKIGKECNIDMAELDLYLWYIETGKILK